MWWCFVAILQEVSTNFLELLQTHMGWCAHGTTLSRSSPAAVDLYFVVVNVSSQYGSLPSFILHREVLDPVLSSHRPGVSDDKFGVSRISSDVEAIVVTDDHSVG